MKHDPLHELLQQIASITAMEPGRLSVIRQGPDGPYFNLQHHEHGRNRTEYIPRSQVAEVERNIAAYQHFSDLVDRYAESIVEQTRRQRKAGLKKKPRIRNASKSADRRKSAT